MKILGYSRIDGLYLVVFKLNFSLLSENKINVLKRALLFVTSEDHILLLADKFQTGIIVSELLEENVILMYPHVTLFKISFDITAIRESRILERILERIGEVPILSFFVVGTTAYIVVRKQDSEKVHEALAMLVERTPLSCNRAF
jgi:hypothetical protein